MYDRKYQFRVSYSPHLITDEQRKQIEIVKKRLEEELRPQIEALKESNKITRKDLSMTMTI